MCIVKTYKLILPHIIQKLLNDAEKALYLVYLHVPLS